MPAMCGRSRVQGTPRPRLFRPIRDRVPDFGRGAIFTFDFL